MQGSQIFPHSFYALICYFQRGRGQWVACYYKRNQVNELNDFRRQVGPGAVDGASLYRFVEATPSFAEARRQLDDLAYLFTQLALMDLDASSLARVEQALAEEFAAAARMPGLDVAALRDAVRTSPVGLID